MKLFKFRHSAGLIREKSLRQAGTPAPPTKDNTSLAISSLTVGEFFRLFGVAGSFRHSRTIQASCRRVIAMAFRGADSGSGEDSSAMM
ncbi:hypothetical protein JIN84_05155 [Luteolibacter yonseiensis]|uniref:Uncharacterized protein n=1 Tax=Luteolibacter yonseiensis TaxID=1144680 RepID=A0A934R146_9BACT|nr:hypothetical protein [Luteolibacter yonseiensis]MBK1814991.1 hypothetical protein [Luteolibacter yonseiensis]